MSEKIRLVAVDYLDREQATDLINLIDDYAKDPMGGGEALPGYVKQTLALEMANVPGAFSYIAYVDEQPAGMVNCFMGFSTFNARPLVNIHDLSVKNEFRGQQISQRLLEVVETVARSRNCCKVTLEVLSQNKVAQSLYKKSGFSRYELNPKTGEAQFWEKSL